MLNGNKRWRRLDLRKDYQECYNVCGLDRVDEGTDRVQM